MGGGQPNIRHESSANFCIIKCIEDSEVTLHTYLAHPLQQGFHSIYVNSSRKLKEYPHFLSKSRKIPVNTNENAT